jgi:2-keto-myo-inositol isomerase
MLDAHRVLVDAADRLENLPQVARLIALGYDGPFSFEPFAAEVHDRADIEAALAESIDHVAAGVGATAAGRPARLAAGA